MFLNYLLKEGEYDLLQRITIVIRLYDQNQLEYCNYNTGTFHLKGILVC